MMAFTLFFICSAIGQPVSGRLVHRYGSRKVIVLGALLSAVGYLLVSRMNDLWQYYLSYSLIGFGVAASGPVITTLIVSNWFVRRRGMAIGAISMGAGTAGLLFTPLVIVYMIPNLGWSNTYLVFAAITALISIPLGALAIRTRPAEMGLLPDGGRPSKIEGMDNAESPSASGLSFRSAMSTGAFWLLAAAILFVSTHMGVMQNQIPHLEDLGFTPGTVASTMSIVAIVSAIGPLVFGWLSDRITVKTAGIIAVVLLVVSIVLLLYVDIKSSPWLIWSYAALLGMGVGGWMTAISLLTSSSFGLIAYGTIYGVLSAFQSIGGAIAPIISGYFYDSTGSYHRAFITMLIIIALGIPVILAIRRPKPVATNAD
jgi:MFS family permease